MTNIGKVLIVGLVLVDLGVVAYLVVPKGDKSTTTTATATGTVATSSVTAVAVDPHISETHVVAGSVLPTAPPVKGTGTGAIAAAPPHKPPAPTLKAASVHESVDSKTSAAQPPGHARDDLGQHGSNPVAAALTQELVKESAKPDPSLPLPSNVSAPDSHDGRGSNPVAAAMTQELVRQSANVAPASQPTARPGTQ